MFYKHNSFILPKSMDSKIWRYLDFTKFISMLDSGTLYFSRSDTLADTFEGKYPKISINSFKNSLTQSGVKNPDVSKMVSSFRTASDEYRKIIFINCWHLNKHESAAMWKSYSSLNNGVAIQSTLKMLAESFKNSPDFDGFLGKVKYIDYEKDKIDSGNMFNAFLHKRKSFQYENEMRAIALNIKIDGKSKPCLDKSGDTLGYFIECDLQALIENIYVSPNSQVWFQNLVNSVLTKNGINSRTIKSAIADSPLY